MSGNRSRVKGRRGEQEWARETGGVRRRIGVPGHDVTSPPWTRFGVTDWEVKRVERLPAVLRGWLEQTVGEGAEALAFREDRGGWWVCIPWDERWET